MHFFLIGILFFFPIFGLAQEKPIIILDGGHGGKDEGARMRGLQEKELTLRTSYLTKNHLETLGYRVILTRARDVFIPLGTRVHLANRRNPSLFVSIHYNSSASPAAKGIEVYYYGRGPSQKRVLSSRNLASSILKGIVNETHAHSRGTKQGNFQVIRETQMPAVLIEAGFITNSEERALIATQAYLDKLAKGIAYGVDIYVGSKSSHKLNK